jgi:hypothetical protein
MVTLWWRSTSRLGFVVISVASLFSILIVSLVTTAAASEGDRGLLSYVPKPYNNLLGQKDTALDTIKEQVKEIQFSEQADGKLSNHISTDSSAYKPIVSSEGTISWILTDSKGQQYRLTLTKEDYLKSTSDLPVQIKYLETKNGSLIAVLDHAKYVQSNPALSELADAIYQNTANDYEFIQEVRYIVTHYTEYTPEVIEQASRPIATLESGKGDCEDLVILMASILAASSYTSDWDIQMVYFDAFNAQEPNTANHVALFIQTDEFSTFVESTNPGLDGSSVWQQVDGWYVEVSI